MKTTFALYFGNRGFFPETLIAAAREETESALHQIGIDTISLAPEATRFGAVETAAEGRVYAEFLKKNEGKFDGVILVLPNFGDENGASEALKNAHVPIYILAYPDEIDKMDFLHRRDAFCGKFSIMDVFTQFGIPFTAWPPHTLSPRDAEFAAQMKEFAAVCRIVKALRNCRIGAIGARPTLFKTIRFDEVALQKFGITTEVFDNSDLLVRVEKLRDDAPEVTAKVARFNGYSDFSAVPAAKLLELAKVSVAIDQLIAEKELSAIGLRCWSDLQETIKLSPCVILGELNDRGIPAACELDMCNAIAMLALHAASGESPACLDWNNNYPGDPESCILFHCGSTARSLMRSQGRVIDHPMFAKSLGAGCGYGCHVGFIRPMDFTFSSITTKDGKICFYSGEGAFDERPLGEGYFGCGGAARIENLQRKLTAIGYGGYRHHVSVTPGRWQRALDEALTRYLGYEKTEI